MVVYSFPPRLNFDADDAPVHMLLAGLLVYFDIIRQKSRGKISIHFLENRAALHSERE